MVINNLKIDTGLSWLSSEKLHQKVTAHLTGNIEHSLQSDILTSLSVLTSKGNRDMKLAYCTSTI